MHEKVLLEVISSLIAELAYYVGLLESPTFMNELMFCIADNVDFSKYAEKVFSIAKPLKATLTVESRFDPPYFMILNNECIYGMVYLYRIKSEPNE